MKKRLFLGLLGVLLLVNLCSCSLVNAAISKWTAKEPAQKVEGSVNHEEIQQEEAVALELSCYTATMTSGEVLHIAATTNATAALRWESSNEAVALVNSQGDVTAVGEGFANITCCADGDVKATCTVTVKAEEKQEAPAVSSDAIFPHSSSAYLTEAEVRTTLAAQTGPSPSGGYAQDAINEIYARNGYMFKNPTIQAYYEAKPWYSPDSTFSEASLNDYEKKNIDLLKTFK